jgi:hypothetical protein
VSLATSGAKVKNNMKLETKAPTCVLLGTEATAHDGVEDCSLDGIIEAVGSMSIENERMSQRNPHPYMKALTQDTEGLMRVMRESSTVLTGSRAAAFFYKGACTEASDWDFCCVGEKNAVQSFEEGMEKIGTKWETDRGAKNDYVQDYYYESFNVRTGVMNGNKVQLIWTDGKSSFEFVLRFHSTLVQCFISGFCAVSMYHDLGSKRTFFKWCVKQQMERRKGRVLACIEKYEKRGFREVAYTPGVSSVKTAGVRRLADPECMVVDFGPYISSYEMLSDIVAHNRTLNDTLSLSWLEKVAE